MAPNQSRTCCSLFLISTFIHSIRSFIMYFIFYIFICIYNVCSGVFLFLCTSQASIISIWYGSSNMYVTRCSRPSESSSLLLLLGSTVTVSKRKRVCRKFLSSVILQIRLDSKCSLLCNAGKEKLIPVPDELLQCIIINYMAQLYLKLAVIQHPDLLPSLPTFLEDFWFVFSHSNLFSFIYIVACGRYCQSICYH